MIGGFATLHRPGQPGGDAVDVVLVNVGFHLMPVHHVDAAYHLSGSDGLSQLQRQLSQLAVGRSAYGQIVAPLADEVEAQTHVLKVALKLAYLDAAVDGVLAQPLADKFALLRGKLKVLLCLQIFFFGNQVFVEQTFVLLKRASFLSHIDVELQFFCAVA